MNLHTRALFPSEQADMKAGKLAGRETDAWVWWLIRVASKPC